MSRPFSEIIDGLPAWNLQVEDPQASAEAEAKPAFRFLGLPQGGVVAAALRLYDKPGARPHLFHICGPAGSYELQNWLKTLQSKSQILLVFERHGWLNSVKKVLNVDAAEIRGILFEIASMDKVKDPDAAVTWYASYYKENLPKLNDPEEVWAALSASFKPARRAAKAKAGALGLLILILILAAAAFVGWKLGLIPLPH
jgi:hypothetical protein